MFLTLGLCCYKRSCFWDLKNCILHKKSLLMFAKLFSLVYFVFLKGCFLVTGLLHVWESMWEVLGKTVG